MNKDQLAKKKKSVSPVLSTEVQNSIEKLQELAKLQEKAADEKDFNLCRLIQLEIQRCLHQKAFLIPSGQIDGLILDPMAVLLGK